MLKHFQHENLLQYVGASNAESVEPGGEILSEIWGFGVEKVETKRKYSRSWDEDRALVCVMACLLAQIIL